MNVLTGKSFRQQLDNNKYLDVSIYQRKYHTKISMDLWEEGNGVALAFEERNHINYDKFLPLWLAEKLARYMINKQSMKIAGFELV